MAETEKPAEAVSGPVAVDSDVAHKSVKSFCEYVVWLKGIHQIYVQLFESEEGERLMRGTAIAFFSDLNKIIIDYLLLAMARISDPPRTGKHENFTVENLLETIAWPSEVLARLRELNGTLTAFRGQVVAARNRLVAHLDKQSFVHDVQLGQFPKGKDREVMSALEEMCNVMHKAAFGEIFGSIQVGVWGDVGDLKKFLRRGLAFETLWKEAKGDRLLELHELLKGV